MPRRAVIDKEIVAKIGGSDKLKRDKDRLPPKPKEPIPVTQGPVGELIPLVFNATRDKLREVTIIDRMQGRLLPQLDVQQCAIQHILNIASYNYDSEKYLADHDDELPIAPDLIEEFIHRTAQWQKSVAGLSLMKAMELTLAEIETRDTDNFGDDGNWNTGTRD